MVSEPLRLSIPTRPGHCPDQLATVRMGPEWLESPGRTWLEYCQTASATTSGALESTEANTSIPSRALAMKPWPRAFEGAWPRTSVRPAAAKARVKSASICFWAGQQTRLASSRRSPLATRTTSAFRRGVAGDFEREEVAMTRVPKREKRRVGNKTEDRFRESPLHRGWKQGAWANYTLCHVDAGKGSRGGNVPAFIHQPDHRILFERPGRGADHELQCPWFLPPFAPPRRDWHWRAVRCQG